MAVVAGVQWQLLQHIVSHVLAADLQRCARCGFVSFRAYMCLLLSEPARKHTCILMPTFGTVVHISSWSCSRLIAHRVRWEHHLRSRESFAYLSCLLPATFDMGSRMLPHQTFVQDGTSCVVFCVRSTLAVAGVRSVAREVAEGGRAFQHLLASRPQVELMQDGLAHCASDRGLRLQLASCCHRVVPAIVQTLQTLLPD